MKLRDELHRAARPAALLLGILFGAALLIGAATAYRASEEQALDQARRQHAAALAKVQSVASERQDIALYQPRFEALQGRGLLGQENRLGWIEALRAIQVNRKLVSASYEVAPQQQVALSAPFELGDYRLKGSRMRVELGLVHELDLFHFIDDMRAAGSFSVQDCKVKRTDYPAEAVGVARLLADCTLVFVTLEGS